MVCMLIMDKEKFCKMNYYIRETIFDEIRNRTAASKAREDINKIAESMGFQAINVEYDYSLRKSKGFFNALRKLTRDWDKALSIIKKNDAILIQFPLNHHPLQIAEKLNKVHSRGGKVILLIHDIDCLRMSNSTFQDKIKHLIVKIEDITILKRGDAIIAHNNKMIKVLKKIGIDTKVLISLEIFDYLVNENIQYKNRSLNDPIIIAGTLRKGKAEYIYNLPDQMTFNLYGVGYENKEKINIIYNGSFNPEELIDKMEGSFGLVWDGNSCETCDGISGKYVKINNPHKLSLYLAAGLPVIVWIRAAVADFVKTKQVGICINKISEIQSKINNIDEKNYNNMKDNAKKISMKLIKGYYTQSALLKALEIVFK